MSTKRFLLTVLLFHQVTCFGLMGQDYDDVQFTSVKVADNIYMLQGAGGNIGLFFGPDGLFLIDDQFAPLHDKLIAKIAEISDGLINDVSDGFLLNTHFHHDHTGGNELLGQTGAVIVAHENGRRRLTVEQVVPFFGTRNPAVAPSGLPVVTFSQDITFHLNGDSLSVFHVEAAHTDGDAIVHFTRANVIHTGDIVFMQAYPFIDLDNGGSVEGVIKAVERILALVDEKTKIIPGHGNMTDRAGLVKYHEMLVKTWDSVSRLVAEGKSLEQIQAAKTTAQFDEDFNGFIDSQAFVGLLYRDLTE